MLPTTVGGPAAGTRGEEFTPGKFLRYGLGFSSRGCPNACWFCKVHERDGNIRELPITNFWNVLDDNILACSGSHIRAVCDMLRKQPHRPVFSGGIEALRLKQWHAELFREIKTDRLYCAQ